jgi:TonB family protein
MKHFTISCIVIALILSPVSLSAEPTSEGLVNYKGEDLPLYDSTQLPPSHAVKPIYPTAERRNGVQGTVIIIAIVDSEGKVVEAGVKSSQPSAAFGVAGKASVLQWSYPKMTKDGKPTGFLVRVHLSFSIR